jgi:hypothetical protein
MKKLVFIIPFILISLVLTILIFDGCEIDPDAVFTVIYHGNGQSSGYAPVDTNEYKSGMEATVLGQNDLSKPGYMFRGWNIRPDGSGLLHNPGDKIKLTNITIFLYAAWKKDE